MRYLILGRKIDLNSQSNKLTVPNELAKAHTDFRYFLMNKSPLNQNQSATQTASVNSKGQATTGFGMLISSLAAVPADFDTAKCQKSAASSNQRRMLTQLEIELLQKDKRDSFDKMLEIMKSQG